MCTRMEFYFGKCGTDRCVVCLVFFFSFARLLFFLQCARCLFRTVPANFLKSTKQSFPKRPLLLSFVSHRSFSFSMPAYFFSFFASHTRPGIGALWKHGCEPDCPQRGDEAQSPPHQQKVSRKNGKVHGLVLGSRSGSTAEF